MTDKTHEDAAIEYGTAEELFKDRERVNIETEAIAVGTREYTCEEHTLHREVSLAAFVKGTPHVLEIGIPLAAVPTLIAGLMAMSTLLTAKNVAESIEDPGMNVEWDKAAKA